MKINMQSLSGLWYYFESDSTYIEIYYTDSSYLAFLPDNFIFKKYKFDENDNFSVDFGQKDIHKFKLHDIDSDSFISTRNGVSIVHKRLRDSIFNPDDWKKIILVSDSNLFNKSRLYYLSREFDHRSH